MEPLGDSYFQFLFGVELKKRHYLKQLEGRKHMVEEVYLVERENVGNKTENKESKGYNKNRKPRIN